MTLARLLAAVLVVCSLPAFAQDQPKGGPIDHNVFSFDFPCFAPPSEPWRIFPDRHADLGSAQNPRYQFWLARPELECRPDVSLTKKGFAIPGDLRSCSQRPDADATCHIVRSYFMHTLPNGEAAHVDMPVNDLDLVGPTCYAIRSYVVARDSKDSDSTHPAGYSTCQPSNRYRVKRADLRVVSGDR